MSNYKPEILPSGVLIRKIKGDENEFVLSNSEQALIVTKRDIARMHGIVFPEVRLSEKCRDVQAKKENDFYCGGNDITGNGKCTNQCDICRQNITNH